MRLHIGTGGEISGLTAFIEAYKPVLAIPATFVGTPAVIACTTASWVVASRS